MNIEWLNPGGGYQTDEEWADGHARLHRAQAPGGAPTRRRRRPGGGTGEAAPDELVIILNAHDGPVEFKLPDREAAWRVVVDTNEPDAEPGQAIEALGRRAVPWSLRARSCSWNEHRARHHG